MVAPGRARVVHEINAPALVGEVRSRRMRFNGRDLSGASMTSPSLKAQEGQQHESTARTLIGMSILALTFGAQQASAIECILDTVNDGSVTYDTGGTIGPNFDTATDGDGGAIGSLESALVCGTSAIAANVDT
jgi:hypothetical protein